VVFLDPCKADVHFDSYRHLAVWNMTLRPWVTTLAVIGTFATCQLYRAMSDFKGNPECAGRPARSRWCKSITMKE
jgi:hypothetical protein